MKSVLLIFTLLLASDSFGRLNRLPENIVIFTTHTSKPVYAEESRRNGIAVDVYYMDTLQDIEKKLSYSLPQTREKAEKELDKRLNQYAPEIERRISKLRNGINLYNYYGIEKRPAAVINGCHFVYNIVDTRELVRSWRKAGSC